MTIFPEGTRVRVTGRRFEMGIPEPPWTGRVLHSWTVGGTTFFTVQPDKGDLACEVRGEHIKEIRG